MEELLNPVQEEAVDAIEAAPDTQEAQAPENYEVVDIQFRPGQKIYFFDPDGMQFETGDHVVMDTARGAEFGICAGGNHIIPAKEIVAPLRKILRKATPQDEKINAENRAKEKRAFEICMQKIEVHNLDMQLVSAECAFDCSKILFYFTADERVDFRELVKDLASVFHTRIELRQIGVRDKAKMVGGLGICGRPFCCASFLDDFQPVSIKMAKTQNLSLNPTKISGTCGRLMCCLKYEQDTYEDLIRSSPKVDSFVDTPEGRGTVVESEILRQRVKVQMEENPETIAVFANEDIAVLRSGKAKKNDPPIPADLAPISGAGKRPRKPRETESAPILEPIRFRYSTESIVEEPSAAQPAAPVESAEPAEPRQPRQRRQRPPRPEVPAAAAAAVTAEVTAQPAAAPVEAEPEKAPQRKPRRDQRQRPPRQPRPEDKPAEQAEKSERPERPERAGKIEQAEKPERPAKPERRERPNKPERREKPEHPERTEKPERHEKPERPKRAEKPEAVNGETPDQAAGHSENGGRNHHRRNQNRPPRKNPQQPGGESAPNPNPAPAPANAAPQPAADGHAPKPHRRNNHHRPHKPKAPQE